MSLLLLRLLFATGGCRRGLLLTCIATHCGSIKHLSEFSSLPFSLSLFLSLSLSSAHKNFFLSKLCRVINRNGNGSGCYCFPWLAVTTASNYQNSLPCLGFSLLLFRNDNCLFILFPIYFSVLHSTTCYQFLIDLSFERTNERTSERAKLDGLYDDIGSNCKIIYHIL